MNGDPLVPVFLWGEEGQTGTSAAQTKMSKPALLAPATPAGVSTSNADFEAGPDATGARWWQRVTFKGMAENGGGE